MSYCHTNTHICKEIRVRGVGMGGHRHMYTRAQGCDGMTMTNRADQSRRAGSTKERATNMNMTFDEAVAAMVRDCALVSDKGNIVDLTKPRVRRKAASVISYRRLYAPLVRTLGQNARGVDVCVHVVDTWLHHPDRKTVYPGELEYPLHENEWWWVEAASKHPSIYRIPDHLRNNPNYKPSLKVVK